MSFEALKWAFNVSEGHQMGSADRLVLWYLANMHNDEQRKAWPSQKRICDMTGLSKAGVNRALNSLIEAGLIRRKVGLGRRNTQYILGVDFADNCSTWSLTDTTTDGVVSGGDTILLTKPHPINSESKEAHASGAAQKQTTEKPMKLQKGMTVSSIVSAASTEYAEVPDEKITTLKRGPKGKFTPQAIAGCWKAAHGKYAKGFVGELRLKDIGQLKQAYAKVGDVLPVLILTCLRDWNGFCQQVKQSTSTFNVPAKPEVGFFVRHAGIAVDFAMKGEAEPAQGVKSVTEHLAKVATQTPKVVQSIATTPTPSTTLSVADIEDAFDGSDD